MIRHTGGLPVGLLAAASLGMFAASSSGTTRAPFLIDMAHDLAASLPLVADLFAMTSIAWGVASMLAGVGSDRWGRRPFLFGGPLALALALAGVATAGSYVEVAIWATIAGGCSGMYTGVIFAEVSARVTDSQQGRALGWAMSGQSLTLLVGVPMAAWVGAYVGWRGVNLGVAGLGLAAAAGFLAVGVSHNGPGGAGINSGSSRQETPSMRTALSPKVLRLLTIGIGERICYGLTAVYFATFLQSSYGLSLEALALPLAVFAMGNICGTVVGGQLADRLPNRFHTFALAMLASGGAALALFGWITSVTTSVVLGFVYVFVNAIARPSLLAALTTVPVEIRGTVLGLNMTCASIGWMGAAGLGGWMMGLHGFAAFGPLAAAVSILTAGLALLPFQPSRG